MRHSPRNSSPLDFRPKYFACLCDQPNVSVPSENFLIGDPTREPWELPAECVKWLEENVGPESDTPELTDGGAWNWAIDELYPAEITKMTDRFAAHFVFADMKAAALFKMVWG